MLLYYRFLPWLMDVWCLASGFIKELKTKKKQSTKREIWYNAVVFGCIIYEYMALGIYR